MFTLGRKIDIHYPTNKWIAIIAIIVTGVSYFLIREISIAWKVGASVFLTWAMTREIDPKREYAAFVSAFFALSSLLVVFKVDLMIIFFLLLLVRFVNKVTGDKNTILDMITLLGLAGFLSYSGNTSVYILILLIGIFLNIKYTKNKERDTVFFLLAVVAILLMYFILGGYSLSQVLFMESWKMKTSFISLGIYLVFILIDKDKITLDDNGQMLENQKVLNGQILYAIAISLLLIFTRLSIGNLIVYFASIWGYVIYGLFMTLKNKKSR